MPVVSIRGQAQSEVAPPAKSDTYAVDEAGKKYRLQHREVAATNFRISGVDLASDEPVLLQAAKLFGKSAAVWSGDASTANEEACYRSATENDNTYLIFGHGEVDSYFTLSSDSAAWKGNQTCETSVKVTRALATESGLQLGLSQKQLIATLGLATSRSQNIQKHRERLIYRLETQKKKDKNPESYALEVYIDARFENDLLVGLTVSWSAQR